MTSPVRRSQRSRTPVTETYYQKAQRELRESIESSKSSLSSKRTPEEQKEQRSGTRTPSSRRKSQTPRSGTRSGRRNEGLKRKNNDEDSDNEDTDEEMNADKDVESEGEQDEENEPMMQSSDEDADSSDDEEFIKDRKTQKKRKSKAIRKNSTSKRQRNVQLVEPIEKSGKKQKASGKPIQRQSHVPLTVMARKVLSEHENPDSSLVASLLYSKTTSSKKHKTVSVSAIDSIARKTANHLLKTPLRAHIDLLNLIFRSVGCKYENLLPNHVDLDEISDNEMTSIIEQMVEDMAATPTDSILLCADPNGAIAGKLGGNSRSKVAAKEYRQIYENFWYELGLAIVSDTFDTMKNQVAVAHYLVSRLMEMVWVGVPDIRAAFAIAIYQLAASLLQSTAQWQSKLHVAQRQWQSAKRVHTSTTSRKVKVLEQQVEFLKQSVAAVEGIVQENVMSVLLKRYRDKNEHIRVESLRALSSFTIIRPDLFLNGTHLKYFGWMLSDKVARVRKFSLLGLLAPFQHNESIIDYDDNRSVNSDKAIDTSGMKSAIEKFLSRLAECVLDVDVEVQGTAMELLLYLIRHDFFDDVDNDQIWQQINLRAIDPKTTLAVRRNALYFVMEQLPQFDCGSSESDGDAVQRIKALVEWISNVISGSDIPLERIKYELVDLVVGSLRSMFEHKPLVTNWTAILRTLQGDNSTNALMGRKSIGKGDQRQDAVQQRVLLRWLVSSAEMEVRSLQNAADDDPSNNPMLQDMDREFLEIQATLAKSLTTESIPDKNRVKHRTSTSQEELTLALLKTLPEFFVSFKSEITVLQSLSVLPRYLLPSVFNLSSRKKDFHLLLSTMSKTFFEATDETVLANCALSLVSFTRGDHARKDEALLVLKQTTSALRARLFELLDEKLKRICDKNNDEQEADLDTDVNNPMEWQHDSEHSLFQCLRRLRILSKRWYLPDLLIDQTESHESEDDHLERLFTAIADNVYKDLTSRQPIFSQDNLDDAEFPKIWYMPDENVHAVVAKSISESLDLLLTLTAWKVSSVVDSLKSAKSSGDSNEEVDDVVDSLKSAKSSGDSNEEVDDHIVLRMRDHLYKLAVLCYEQFVEPEYMEKVPKSQMEFSVAVQEYAGRLTGDLRMLFPKQWAMAKSKLLASLALTQEVHLVGGLVRFVRSQEERLRACAASIGSNKNDAVYDLLLPLARGLAGNWLYGNRKEAGVALAHISGSGGEAQELVQSLCRVCKKIHPVRLLESHMAYLRQDFTDWKATQPKELDSDQPTDAELAEFDNAEKIHKAKFAAIENRATRLSASLGVGSIRDKVLASALVGFIREGIRYAFSTAPEGTDDDVPLGDRLTFLLPLSKYLNWIRRNKAAREVVANDINKRELELRNDPECEEVYEEDSAAIVAFRKAGDLGLFIGLAAEDPTESGSITHTNTVSSVRRGADSDALSDVDGTTVERKSTLHSSSRLVAGGSMSTATGRSKFSSSQSLSPLREEDEEEDNKKDLEANDTDPTHAFNANEDDEISQLSPSPRLKRHRADQTEAINLVATKATEEREA